MLTLAGNTRLPQIKTLIPDIYKLISEEPKFKEEDVREFTEGLSRTIVSRLSEPRLPGRLRLSNLGTKCSRKLWYTINTPGRAIPLPAPARIKFLFGDILESLLFFLAKAAGHDVSDQQKRVEINGVQGSMDGRIDGHLVDAKSASSFSFKKFEEGLKEETDAFGYLTQLSSYARADGGDEASFLVIDKTLGKIVLDTHRITRPKEYFERLADQRREMLALPKPPPRGFGDTPEGSSGNRKLGVECGYCEFRKECWPGLRAFAYSHKPVYLTHVQKEPKVPEIDIEAEAP